MLVGVGDDAARQQPGVLAGRGSAAVVVVVVVVVVRGRAGDGPTGVPAGIPAGVPRRRHVGVKS